MSNANCASLSESLFTLHKSRSPRHSETPQVGRCNFTMVILLVFSILAIGHLIARPCTTAARGADGVRQSHESRCWRLRRLECLHPTLCRRAVGAVAVGACTAA